MSPPLLAVALAYAAHGLPVLPVSVTRNAATVVGSHGEWRKAPLNRSEVAGQGGSRGASMDAGQISAWWASHPGAQLGIAPGHPLAGGGFLLVVDDDGALRAAEALIGALPINTVRVATPSGGAHVYLRTPAPIGNGKGALKGPAVKDLDVRGLGGFVVAPPSERPDGARWVGRIDIDRIEWLPTAWLEALTTEPPRAAPPPPRPATDGRSRELAYAEGTLRGACQRIAGATPGERHDRIRDESVTVGGMLWTGLDRAVAEADLCAAAAVAGKPEERRTVADGLAHGEGRPRPIPESSRTGGGGAGGAGDTPNAAGYQRAPRPAPAEVADPTDHALDRCTDLGNARRFVTHLAADFRWCPSTAHGGWLHWTGARWEADEGSAAPRAAKGVSRIVRAEAPRAADDARARLSEADPKVRDAAAGKAFADHMHWADISESVSRLDAVLTVARSEPEVIVRREQLDADPWVFNTPNATIDLRTLNVQNNDRRDLLMHCGGAVYDPEAACPRWEAFISEIMAGDAEMIAYLQRIAGYCMVGVVREAAFFIFWGGGRNGKGTFVERVRKVLGSYATNTPTSTFVGRAQVGVPNDLAALVGKRMVTMSEVEEGAKLEEALVKQVTGKDPVTCRFMRAEFFDFIPVFTPILSCNHKPVVKGMGPATWGRLHLVPFGVTFAGREDLTLPDALDLEASGILNWCLRGLVAWRDGGLNPPAVAMAAHATYRGEMDIIGRFIEDSIAEKPDAVIENVAMYRAFVRWCEQAGEHGKSQRWLTQQLVQRGYQQKTGSRAWVGLALLLISSAPDDRERERWGDR